MLIVKEEISDLFLNKVQETSRIQKKKKRYCRKAQADKKRM